jgi:serine/threonine protein kinase
VTGLDEEAADGAVASVAPGALLASKYHIDALIGRGAMGSMWRATHIDLQRPVAVKVISAAYARLPEARRRFATEAKAAAVIKSRHVVQIYDNGLLDDGTPFIVMEYLEGRTLGDLLRDGPLPLEQALGWLAQACRGLDRAHAAGVVHRDIKPQNLFLAHSEEDDGNIVKVLDFGVARVVAGAGDVSATRAGAPLGTPFYMSPERARGLRDIDHRTDLYSLGQVAYTMLTGKPAFSGEALGEVLEQICTAPLPGLVAAAPWLPPELDAWFSKACAREPAGRYATAREMFDALQQACGLPPHDPAAPRSHYISTPAHPSRAALRLAASAPSGAHAAPPDASTVARDPSHGASTPGVEGTGAYASAPAPEIAASTAPDASGPIAAAKPLVPSVVEARTSGPVEELTTSRRRPPLLAAFATLIFVGGALFALNAGRTGGSRRGEAVDAASAVSAAREPGPPAEAIAPAATSAVEPARAGEAPKPSHSAHPGRTRPPASTPHKKGGGHRPKRPTPDVGF